MFPIIYFSFLFQWFLEVGVDEWKWYCQNHCVFLNDIFKKRVGTYNVLSMQNKNVNISSFTCKFCKCINSKLSEKGFTAHFTEGKIES